MLVRNEMIWVVRIPTNAQALTLKADSRFCSAIHQVVEQQIRWADNDEVAQYLRMRYDEGLPVAQMRRLMQISPARFQDVAISAHFLIARCLEFQAPELVRQFATPLPHDEVLALYPASPGSHRKRAGNSVTH